MCDRKQDSNQFVHELYVSRDMRANNIPLSPSIPPLSPPPGSQLFGLWISIFLQSLSEFVNNQIVITRVLAW